MLLLLLVTFAFSTTKSAEQTAAIRVAEALAPTTRPINIGCDTDSFAIELELHGWLPMCSKSTLTEASAWLMFNASTEISVTNTDHGPGEVRRIIARERTRLSNPNTVIRTYRIVLKPIAMLAMGPHDSMRRGEIVAYLEQAVIPAFAPDVPDSLRELWHDEATAYEEMVASHDAGGTQWDPNAVATYRAANLAFGNAAISEGFRDPLALQWRFRREQEGGPELVAAYREVFRDFSWSLEPHFFQ